MGQRAATLVALVAVAASACSRGGSGGVEAGPAPSAEIEVSSPAFEDGGTIPVEFTCDGEDVSPPLEWTGVPEEAVELVLVVEDPDAPSATFVHWTVVGVDPAATGAERGAVPRGGRQGMNDFGDPAYGGPCPPGGDQPHRYVFRVSALSGATALEEGVSADEISDAIEGREIARGELVGRFGR